MAGTPPPPASPTGQGSGNFSIDSPTQLEEAITTADDDFEESLLQENSTQLTFPLDTFGLSDDELIGTLMPHPTFQPSPSAPAQSVPRTSSPPPKLYDPSDELLENAKTPARTTRPFLLPVQPKPRTGTPPRKPYDPVPGGKKQRGKFPGGYKKKDKKAKSAKRKPRKKSKQPEDYITKAAKRQRDDDGAGPGAGGLGGGVAV